MSDNQITYHNFVMTLYDIHKTLESILIFFTCDSNRAGRITFSHGEITAIRYANKKGEEAITNMANIHHVRIKQERVNVQLPKDANLPNTQTIIKQLLVFADEAGIEQIQNLENPIAQPSQNTAPQATQTTASLPEPQKKQIETSLIKIIGPMGAFLCQKHVHTATSMNQAMSGLETEISADEFNTLKKMLNI